MFHWYILARISILIRTLQGSYLVLTYLCLRKKIFFKLGPVWNATLNPNYCISFLIFSLVFGIQGKVIVCFLSEFLLSLLILHPFFSKLFIIFCNVFRSCPFSQNISVRYSISGLKYFSEQNFVVLARNSLNMLYQRVYKNVA